MSLIPLPFVSLSVKYFGSAIHRRFEADPGAAVRGQRRRAGGAVGRSRRARLPAGSTRSSSASARANAEYLHRNRRLIALQGFFFPSMAFFLGLGSMLVLWLGSRDVIRGRITVGEFVAFNAYLTMLAGR